MCRADIDDGTEPGTTSQESAKLREAGRRIKLLEQENEGLRRAAAYLSQGASAGKRIYPLIKELAVDGVPVTVTCRVLKLAGQPYYRWLDQPVVDAMLEEAYRANALRDAMKAPSMLGGSFVSAGKGVLVALLASAGVVLPPVALALLDRFKPVLVVADAAHRAMQWIFHRLARHLLRRGGEEQSAGSHGEHRPRPAGRGTGRPTATAFRWCVHGNTRPELPALRRRGRRREETREIAVRATFAALLPADGMTGLLGNPYRCLPGRESSARTVTVVRRPSAQTFLTKWECG